MINLKKMEYDMALTICINELHRGCHKNISSYCNTFETVTEQIKDKLKHILMTQLHFTQMNI
jgi:hypothetical protein